MAALHRAAFARPRPWTSVEIAGLLASPLCFAVWAGGGFALGRVVADEAEVLTIAVDPARQGHGIGSGLLRRLMNEARALGAAAMFLEVAEDNGAARVIYDRAGFLASVRRAGYYGGGDALVMRCELG